MKLEPNDKDIEEMIEKAGAQTEEEFEHIMMDDWDKVICYICGKPMSLFDAREDGNRFAHKECW